MRKLLVAFSAVLLVGIGASAAQAQGTEKCPSPETIKFEAPFQVGDSEGGITITAGGGNNVTFSIGDQIVVTQICVKAGNTAPLFNNFEIDGSMTNGGITITYSCTFPGAIVDNTGDGNNDLVGPCTVTVQGGGQGLGLSHVSFYTQAYVTPEVAGVQVRPAAVGGVSAVSGLAFTGAQITLLVVLLAGLIGAGTLAWTAGRRRASKAE